MAPLESHGKRDKEITRNGDQDACFNHARYDCEASPMKSQLSDCLNKICRMMIPVSITAWMEAFSQGPILR